jgi:hypothetical protein
MFTVARVVLVLAFQRSAVPPAPIQDWPPGFGCEVRLAPGEQLRAYAWDDRWPVPSVVRDPLVRIDHGERGLRPDARLYLPGHSPLEAVACDARVVEELGLARVDGRFGHALGFTPASLLHMALLRPGDDAGWTLSFWLRPGAASAGRTLIRMPGALEVGLDPYGRVRAALLPSGEQLTHPVALPFDRWSHVSIAYDPTFLEQLRVFAGSTSARLVLAPHPPLRIATELLVGDLARDGTGFTGALDELALERLPASTEDSLRAVQVAPAPGVHALELETTFGLRTVELAAGATRDLVLDGPEDFARGELVRTVVEDGVLRWAPAHWVELAPASAPPPRTTHPLVGLGDRRLFTFGGETRDSHWGPMRNTDDTWIFDGAGDRWTRVTGPAPSPRCHVPAAHSPDHDLVLLVGGIRFDVQPWQPDGETWVFHTDTLRWEQRFPAGEVLGNTSDHVLVYLPGLQRFLLMRSWGNSLYDPVANVWERLPVADAVTAAGQPTSYFPASTSAVLDESSGLVVLFGGSYGPDPAVFSDTTALFDVEANRFTVLDPPVRPSARVRGALGYDPGRGLVVLFGGVQGQYSQRHDDLWVFDPRTRLWRELECSNRPPVCGGYFGFGHDDVADRFVLFSGRSTPDRWLSRTWTLDFDEARSGTALYTFDRLGQSGRDGWFADVTTPGDSRVELVVRTSDSGTAWSEWLPASASLPRTRFVQVTAILSPGSSGEVPSILRMGWR